MPPSTEGKYAWTAKIGDKGQLVIPKQARELFDIKPGDTVLILGDIERGLAIANNNDLLHFADAVLSAQEDVRPPESGSHEQPQPLPSEHETE